MIKRYAAILFGVFLMIFSSLVFAHAALAQKPLLPGELNGFSIKDTFVPLDTPVVGTVRSLKGRLIVRHGRKTVAYYAAVGDRLYEHDILYTLADTRCRVRFVTADLVTMGENSHISIDQLVDERKAKKKRSLFSMLKGKAMFYVVRVFRYRQADTRVRTPTAIAGVRGTKFGVKVEAVSRKTAARPLYLADASGMLPAGLLAQNSGGGSQTTVYGFDGEVAVTSTVDNTTRTVSSGQNVTAGPAGAGPITETPPMEEQQFSEATDAPPTAGDDQTDENTGDTGGDDGTVSTNDGDNALPTAPSDVSPEPLPPTPPATGEHVGYFSALLTGVDTGTTTYPILADVYTNTTRKDLDAAEVSGNSIVNPAGSITATATGADEETPYIKRIKSTAIMQGPYDSGDLGTTRPMDFYVDDTLGRNEYMEWGYWTMSTWTPDALNPNLETAISSKAYYIGGMVTPDDAVRGISGYYYGDAYGTYFDGATGIEMTGTFNSYVDVPRNQVTSFYMDVYGGDKFASIYNGSGSFVGSSGEFTVTGGDWNLSAGPVVSAGTIQPNASAACNGSIYGPNGENMGGAWAMDLGSGNNAAVGIFAGQKCSDSGG